MKLFSVVPENLEKTENCKVFKEIQLKIGTGLFAHLQNLTCKSLLIFFVAIVIFFLMEAILDLKSRLFSHTVFTVLKLIQK